MKQNATKVFRKVIPTGVEISLERKTYQITYPISIWREFPEVYHQNFADALAYSLTMHLCLNGHKHIVYNFPPPQFEPFFFEGMIYSLGETTLLGEENVRTSDLLRLFYNRHLSIQFTGRPRLTRFAHVNRNTKNRAVIPFSFGKDSLLTFALTRELGIQPYPLFFREPRSPYENRHKKKLAERFLNEFGVDVQFFPVSAGRLRQTFGNWWGWDLLMTQYTLLLLPFVFGSRARFTFWSHEQECNSTYTDKEGFIINPTFEQNRNWLLFQNNLVRMLGSNTVFSSLIEPLNDLAIIKILHSRYPAIAKYQTSCPQEESVAKTKRWCGKCSKCARIYVYLTGLGISPHRVGFNENMLSERKINLFTLFPGDVPKSSPTDQSGLDRDEQLLAFLLSYRRGVKGALMKRFAKTYLAEARAREGELRERFFGIHTTSTLPYELKNPLLKIYREELTELQ